MYHLQRTIFISDKGGSQYFMLLNNTTPGFGKNFMVKTAPQQVTVLHEVDAGTRIQQGM